MEHNNDPAAAAASVDHAAHAGLLDDLMARIAPCFARRETRLTCRDMVNGLLSKLDDHNCWTLAEATGHASPYRMQHLLSRARVDDRQLLDAAADWAAPVPCPGGASAHYLIAVASRTTAGSRCRTFSHAELTADLVTRRITRFCRCPPLSSAAWQ